MSAIDVYRDFIALRLHFNSRNYNYFKYGGKTSLDLTKFKRYEKLLIKLEKKCPYPEYKDYIISILSIDNEVWVTDLLTEETNEIYTRWKKRTQALTYTFKEELKDLPENWELVRSTEEELLKISKESLCVLFEISDLKEYCPENIKWIGDKYSPFIRHYDRNKMKEIAYNKFNHKTFETPGT
jgi:hypothetical protein